MSTALALSAELSAALAGPLPIWGRVAVAVLLPVVLGFFASRRISGGARLWRYVVDPGRDPIRGRVFRFTDGGVTDTRDLDAL